MSDSGPRDAARSHGGYRSEEQLAAAFERAGWNVVRQPARDRGVDLLVRRKGVAYAVVLKSAAEGRGDRLRPLLAQAVLQSMRAARRGVHPLAVVAAPIVPRRVAEQVMAFGREYAPQVAVGAFDLEGLRVFVGRGLDDLNAEPPLRRSDRSSAPRESGHLFSDLNQWMLKVLLAPDLPDELLAAPRARYRNASELAAAAGVSVMSAFRLVQRLGREGYLNESAPHLSLVRREDLLGRWQASAVRSVKEIPLKLKLPGDPRKRLLEILRGDQVCLALFAAADALGFGFVEGVPTFAYVPRLGPGALRVWRSVRPCEVGEPPDLIVRQAPARESVFRGMVRARGVPCCDVLQVWTDVFAHPARGREQADVIRRRGLARLLHEGR